ELAEKEAQRNRQLVAASALAPHALELSETEEKARRSELELAKATVERIRRESTVVAAPLSDPNKPGKKGRQRIEVRAPVDGVVLRVHQESAGPVQPGTPLLDLGDLGTLELIVDLPTQSAVKVTAGALVRVDGVGNGAQLAGKVRLVEPGAFTKVTALGVEEQRVNVVVVPADGSNEWANLGDGFAADAHIEVHKAENVLKVPLGAVFREGNHAAVFRIDNKHARLTPVEAGSRSAEEVEIKSGLDEASEVVVHPSDKLKDGAPVKPE
ncbi:MAG: efflux RND transporter periplasmic adaptor subunit, partial [Myxococcales bacterium]